MRFLFVLCVILSSVYISIMFKSMHCKYEIACIDVKISQLLLRMNV